MFGSGLRSVSLHGSVQFFVQSTTLVVPQFDLWVKESDEHLVAGSGVQVTSVHDEEQIFVHATVFVFPQLDTWVTVCHWHVRPGSGSRVVSVHGATEHAAGVQSPHIHAEHDGVQYVLFPKSHSLILRSHVLFSHQVLLVSLSSNTQLFHCFVRHETHTTAQWFVHQGQVSTNVTHGWEENDHQYPEHAELWAIDEFGHVNCCWLHEMVTVVDTVHVCTNTHHKLTGTLIVNGCVQTARWPYVFVACHE